MRRIVGGTIILFLWFLFTTFQPELYFPRQVNVDMPQIKQRGRLIVATIYNTVDYFVYRGTPMGFQFEMLRDYAEYSGLELEIVVRDDVQEITKMLVEGQCDLVAINMPVTSVYKQFFTFTTPLMTARQVLVQRYDSLEYKLAVNSIYDLDDKTIVVPRGSAYAQRLRNLALESGIRIHVVEVPENEEQLIRMVATGEIDYTITTDLLAQVNQKYFSFLHTSVEISFPQNLAWAVRRSSPQLLTSLNQFIEVQRQTARLAILRNKYYQNQWASYMVNSDYFVLHTGILSPYDDLIRKYSEELGWDWRLLAALIYQESNFNAQSKSHRGALGLMQLLPATALLFGADTVALQRPATNIAVGVKYLKWLDARLKPLVPNKEERIKFVLAAYNIGIGHIFDAQMLAKKYGKRLDRWADVREFLLNKRFPQYYTDPLVKFGQCWGNQTDNYVSAVLSAYMHYKNLMQNR
ncbi:MAG TPA: transporter substrate-binding domain-containing protein [Bacteroidales bacterium]|nr:transporter substrate-binding domain-containing protein [Bacteroidales bacterium]HOK97839.1 transporter substrate-binding domain-containing protein [Bacteroidales bacterium]HPO64545.1 transporter substrate-binding domain-containing protein [Bacteroidales bacterium]